MELFYIFGQQGRCFGVDPMLGAVLVKWIAGPFPDIAFAVTGSVWEIKDVLGDTEFIWLYDGSGSHKRIEARSA